MTSTLFRDLEIINGGRVLNEIIEAYIRRQSSPTEELKILEAGCGRRWPIDLQGIRYHLTGIDIDEHALDVRKNERKDLDEAILGDVRSADLSASTYDIIYSSYVLEHIKGAEAVLENFVKWLKPGGLVILKFPDRDSVYGFLTRITPFWFHVVYKRYLMGKHNAGKPGFGPYPTFHDKVIGRKRFLEFVRDNDLNILEEYGFGTLPALQSLFTKLVTLVSFGSLSSKHMNLMYILEKRADPTRLPPHVRLSSCLPAGGSARKMDKAQNDKDARLPYVSLVTGRGRSKHAPR